MDSCPGVALHVIQRSRRPGDYRWSSFRSNALGLEDAIITPHPLYYALGRSREMRRAAYAAFVHRGWRPGAQGRPGFPAA